MSRESAEQQKEQKQEKPSLSQRLMSFAGFLVVAAMAGYLFYNAVWGEKTPPDILVSVESIEQNGEDFLVIFRARNDGGEAAANVKVEALLRMGIMDTESATTTLNYIPANSARKGGFFFRKDPRRGRLVLTVTAYQKP